MLIILIVTFENYFTNFLFSVVFICSFIRWMVRPFVKRFHLTFERKTCHVKWIHWKLKFWFYMINHQIIRQFRYEHDFRCENMLVPFYKMFEHVTNVYDTNCLIMIDMFMLVSICVCVWMSLKVFKLNWHSVKLCSTQLLTVWLKMDKVVVTCANKLIFYAFKVFTNIFHPKSYLVLCNNNNRNQHTNKQTNRQIEIYSKHSSIETICLNASPGEKQFSKRWFVWFCKHAKWNRCLD